MSASDRQVDAAAETLLESAIAAFIRGAVGARHAAPSNHLQTLWGGQGSLLRWSTDVPGHESLIVKYIAPDRDASHPRGWNTQQSFARKARSYAIECHWYEHYAVRCHARCKVPRLLGIHRDEQCNLLLLEDLTPAYPRLRDRLNIIEVLPGLHWLAEFHAWFMHEQATGLWPRGCYWHLDTRPDEWQAMSDGPVKMAASWLDERLQQARFQTLVHGDAKLANFCFSHDMTRASAVDFQYVGRGCGMSDVVYYLGSCLSENDCREHEEYCLSSYFRQLHAALQRRADGAAPSASGEQQASFTWTSGMGQQLEQEWRSLYAVAWTDFQRFLLGWMPDHAKVNRYGHELAMRALQDWPGQTADS
ncbi:oxidoreductase family protein [Granulosicoccus sp. 3-233]|uniref:oxidoreductase family protein n=1 Tax=Granulosicoccus sp. 3-233 TaxID=3417969 RepID=UPI003D345B5C